MMSYENKIALAMCDVTFAGVEDGVTYEVRVLAGTNAGYPKLTDDKWPWTREGVEMPRE